MNLNQLEKECEIRKLSVSVTQQLAIILDSDDSILSLLMGNIVKDLENSNSELRFTSNDVEVIRNYSHKIGKSSSLIFLEEWSTMGKSRPKLRHLLEILIKCQLFRAADHLANLIGEPLPQRPQTGPAARVDINVDIGEANGLDRPYSGNEVNRNQPKAKPEIVAPNMNFPSSSANNNGQISLPLIPIGTNPYTNSTIFAPGSTATVHPSISDLMKFSKTATNQPDLIPALSALQVSEQIPMTVNSQHNIPLEQNIPAISGLMASESIPNQSFELPAVLMSMEMPHQSTANSTSNIPMLSSLINGESTSNSRRQISTQSISSSDSE